MKLKGSESNPEQKITPPNEDELFAMIKNSSFLEDSVKGEMATVLSIPTHELRTWLVSKLTEIYLAVNEAYETPNRDDTHLPSLWAKFKVEWQTKMNS